MPDYGALIARHHIPPQSGLGLTLDEGQVLRIIDPLGEQVSDLVAFAREDTREWISSGRTIDYAASIYLSTGDILYSNRCIYRYNVCKSMCTCIYRRI